MADAAREALRARGKWADPAPCRTLQDLSTEPPRRSPVALVLAGGAARGAYEVGVISYVMQEVARDLGGSVPVDILCGTSVGAINACALAAWADEPWRAVDMLLRQWRGLRLEELVRPNTSELGSLLRTLVSLRRPAPVPGDTRRGGVLDPAGIERIVRREIPFSRIRDNLVKGHLDAITVSTTDVATGRTVIFLERAKRGTPRWSRDPTIEVKPTEIGPDHALASAAVPFLFPAVRIGDDFYCDGGLRQNVPLSPARRLGAEGLLVINPRYVGPPSENAAAAQGRPSGARAASEPARRQRASYPGPLFLLGKALNALLLDRIDNDIARLQRINDILYAGQRHYGNDFVDRLNEQLGDDRRIVSLRPLAVVHVRATVDIGAAAGEYVRSREFAARAPAVVGGLLRRIGEWEGEGEADLLSYLLFDGEFASRLIELGRHDAKLHHDELCALFAPRVAPPRSSG